MYQGLRWLDSISNNVFNIKQPYLNIQHEHPSKNHKCRIKLETGSVKM